MDRQMIVDLASSLIRLQSVTPDDAGCIPLLSERLQQAGFVPTYLEFGDVHNLWITHGSGDPVLCFLGHTDVVPPGPASAWHSAPFSPEIRDGYLYGRGAADMKGSIAAMVTALERYVADNPYHSGSLAMLLTSDEEGIAINGTRKVMDYLNEHNISIRWCIVGEPSSDQTAGDVIRIGRRGSLTGRLVVHGKQGHVAYPEAAVNPIHGIAPVLAELCGTVWDNGNEHYPPTGFQISNIDGGTGADNVIPGTVCIRFNFRYPTEVTETGLIERVESMLRGRGLTYELDWLPSSKPYLTRPGQLLSVTQKVIRDAIGHDPALSTAGGTSDGRFIAPGGAEVVELGPVNRTIHQANECVSVEELSVLSGIYERIITELLATNRDSHVISAQNNN